MRKKEAAQLIAFLLPELVGITASSLLVVDYVRPIPVFCSEGSGCEALKHSTYATMFGVPTPVVGLGSFLFLALLTLLPGPRARAGQLALAGMSAVIALYLLYLQHALGTYCTYCLTTDAAALFCLIAAGYRFAKRWDASSGKWGFAGAAVATVLFSAIPLSWGFLKKPEIPKIIVEEGQKTPKGKATVVDFVDFECPFCRMTHLEFEPILASHQAKLRVVRKQVPLTRIHPHAMAAARAACCGEELGKGDTMANALFDADVEELTPEGCARIAEKSGLPMDRFRSCVEDPKTDEKIRADTDAFKAAHGHGLPTIWIDEQKLEGAQPRESLERAVESAIARAGS